jgi:hypothetical protein
MSFLDKILGNAPGQIVTAVGDTIKKFITNDQDRMKFQLELENAMRDELELHLKDVDSARNREIKINESANSSWLAKNTASILAIFWTLAAVGIILAIYLGVGANNPATETQILTGIFGIVMLIIGFYFGSSQSSQKNRDTINELVRKQK